MAKARFTQPEVQRFIRGCEAEGVDVAAVVMTLHPDGSITFAANPTLPESMRPPQTGKLKRWGEKTNT